MAKPMPAIFFGHGNPMNALSHNAWTEGWAPSAKTFGARMPCYVSRPTGIFRDGDKVSFPVEGFDGGSISMLSVKIG